MSSIFEPVARIEIGGELYALEVSAQSDIKKTAEMAAEAAKRFLPLLQNLQQKPGQLLDNYHFCLLGVYAGLQRQADIDQKAWKSFAKLFEADVDGALLTKAKPTPAPRETPSARNLKKLSEATDGVAPELEEVNEQPKRGNSMSQPAAAAADARPPITIYDPNPRPPPPAQQAGSVMRQSRVKPSKLSLSATSIGTAFRNLIEGMHTEIDKSYTHNSIFKNKLHWEVEDGLLGKAKTIPLFAASWLSSPIPALLEKIDEKIFSRGPKIIDTTNIGSTVITGGLVAGNGLIRIALLVIAAVAKLAVFAIVALAGYFTEAAAFVIVLALGAAVNAIGIPTAILLKRVNELLKRVDALEAALEQERQRTAAAAGPAAPSVVDEGKLRVEQPSDQG